MLDACFVRSLSQVFCAAFPGTKKTSAEIRYVWWVQFGKVCAGVASTIEANHWKGLYHSFDRFRHWYITPCQQGLSLTFSQRIRDHSSLL